MSPTTDRVPVRDLCGVSSARGDRKLDQALGLNTMAIVACALCASALDFGTDTLGRSTETCRSCGHIAYPAKPAVRPDGDGYMTMTREARREPRPQPESTDPAVLLLRATRAARAAAGPSPAMLEAKRMYEANQAAYLASRSKGGRPKKVVAVRRGPVEILDDEPPPPPPTPAAPSRLPAVPSLPPSAPDMPKTFAPRACALPSCQSDFTPTGSTQRYCSVEHREEHKRAESAPKKAGKRGRPRKAVQTGFKSSHAEKNGGGVRRRDRAARDEDRGLGRRAETARRDAGSPSLARG